MIITIPSRLDSNVVKNSHVRETRNSTLRQLSQNFLLSLVLYNTLVMHFSSLIQGLALAERIYESFNCVQYVSRDESSRHN